VRSYIALIAGKLTRFVSGVLGLGAGGTWPGEVALSISPQILTTLSSQLTEGIIIVAGTNGKTTTSSIIAKILEEKGRRVIHNATGANLVNGITSTLLRNANWLGNLQADWGVFETDENSLPRILSEFKIHPDQIGTKFKIIVVLLNLFRDQLDRYGEVDVIAEKWEKALLPLPKDTTVVLNADDPGIVGIGEKLYCKKIYFGIEDKKLLQSKIQHAVDSVFCPNCGSRLTFAGTFFSHLGHWNCKKCKLKRPCPTIYDGNVKLPGLYNRYNVYAAIGASLVLGINKQIIDQTLAHVTAAFGRQEELTILGKRVKLVLSKNPTGFNESLRTVISLGARHLLFVLNDRIPDGRDVSWIWDVDFEQLPAWVTPVVSGDRAYDLALRLKYARPVHKLPKGAVSEPVTPILVYERLETALKFCLEGIDVKETLYILPTYSAMLEVRKILTGSKIL